MVQTVSMDAARCYQNIEGLWLSRRNFAEATGLLKRYDLVIVDSTLLVLLE